jgi:gluconokinase
MVIILRGVAGSGKTTIGRALATALGWPFYDADDFHSSANKQKMAAGQALTDHDRRPWLNQLAGRIGCWSELSTGSVLACSALKASYRSLLTGRIDAEQVVYIHLRGSKALIARRLTRRQAHYMPPELLDSQYEILEQPDDALMVDIGGTPTEIVREIRLEMNL